MDKPILTFNQVAPLILQQYERYLPSAFDDSMTLLQKVNQVIKHLDQIGELTNNVVVQWNEVMEWVMLDGITDIISQKLDLMVQDGTFDQIINETLFNQLNQDIIDLGNEFSILESLLSDPRYFGAKGDGVADDTAALEAWIGSTRKSLVLRSGIFRTTRGLVSSVAERSIISEGGSIKADSQDMTVLTVTGDYTTVSIEIDGARKAAIGIFVDKAKQCQIKNNTVKNMYGIGVGGCGIKIQTKYGAVVDDNTILNIDSATNNTLGDNAGASRAILFTDPDNTNAVELTRITNNYIDTVIGEEGDGIQVLFYNGVSTDAFITALCEIKNNTIKNANRRAIKIQASHVTVANNRHVNTLTTGMNAATAFEVLNSHYVTFENNHIDAREGFMGLAAQGSSGVVLDNLIIKGNTIRGNDTRDAMFLDQLTDAVIEGNVVYDGKRGMSIGNARGTTVKSNVIYGGNGADVGINISQSCTYMTVQNNSQPSGSRTGLLAASSTYSVFENNHSMVGVCVIGSSAAARSIVRNNTNYSNEEATYIGNFSTSLKGTGFNVGSGGSGSGEIMFGTAAPTVHSFNKGDIVYNLNVAAGGKVGWVCVTSGSPGTWKPFGTVDA